MLTFDRSRQRIEEAAPYLAGGVSSHFRLGMSPHPLVFDHAEGPYLFDVDGNRLIDYYLGMGPMILGHTPAPVLSAVEAQLKRGLLYAGQSEIEFEAARLVCNMVPCAERVRFGSSGSEVVQAALRLARAATNKSIIVKFEGHYHGWFDNVLWSVAPTAAQMGEANAPNLIPGSAGQDAASGENIAVLPWNNLDLLTQRLERGDVAGVIMEPAMCNTSAIAPLAGYLEGVRAACNDAGAVLIFDEVITGFRVGPGGAQAHFGVTPDLAVFGKAIANGFPVACLAGRADLMELIASRKVMHGGTYNAQPIGMAATVATLTALSQPGCYEALNRSGLRLMEGIRSALQAADVPARLQGFPTIFHVALGVDTPITDYRSSLAADRARYIRLTTALLQRGVRALERGAWFLSLAHTDDVIDATLSIFEDAARTV